MRFTTKAEESVVLKPGMRFNRIEFAEATEEYIVANCGYSLNGKGPISYALINLTDGNRWAQMSSLKDLADYLSDNDDFTLIK
jgi:hypothetical protein